MHPDPDELTLLALGETDPAVADHVAGCPACEGALAALAETAALARAAGPDHPPAPPPRVWDGIAAELAAGRADTGTPAEPAAPREPTRQPPAPVNATPRKPVPAPAAVPASTPAAAAVRVPAVVHWWRGTPALVAAAMTVVMLALGGGWALGRSGAPAGPRVLNTATLRPLAESPEQAAAGTAQVQAAGDQQLLNVDASGLPAPDGYYEVWLFDPNSGRMVAMGTLDPAQHGTFPMPPNLDPAAYPVVDISAQLYNGDNTHSEVSVLRGRFGS